MLSAVCAAVICAGVTAVRAQDTPAQAAALEALKQKMSEIDAQPSQPANPSLQPVVVTPSITVPEQPTPPAAPPVAATVTPPVATQPLAPAPVSLADDSGLFTPVPPPSHPGAPAAMPEKKPEPKPEPATPQTKSPAATNVTPATAQAVPAAQPKVNQKTETKPAAAPSPAKNTAKVKSPQPELNKKAATKPAVASTPSKKEAKAKSKNKPAAATPKPVKPEDMVYPGRSLGFNPIEPPPLPVSAEQETALRALLGRYMANEITPDQYQAERKKIRDGQ